MYISFHDTHIYPGCIATVTDVKVAADDNFNAIAEFSDGVVTPSLWEEIEPKKAVLHISGYRTSRGTEIADRACTLAQDDGHWKVISSNRS